MEGSTVEWSTEASFSAMQPTSAQPASSVIFLAIQMSLSIAVLPGNLLVIVAFWREKDLRAPCNYLIFNQSVIDALSAVFCLPYAFFMYHATGVEILNQSKNICFFTVTTVAAFVASSAVNILTISVQRMFLILFPHLSRSPRMSSMTLIVILLNHLILFIYFGLPFFGLHTNWQPDADLPCVYFTVYPQAYTSTGILLCAAPIFGIVGSNIFIYQRYKKQKRLIQSVGTVRTSNDHQTKKDWKLTMMLVTVAAVFLASWTPLIILDVIQRVFPGVKSESAFWVAFDVSQLPVLANGIINPLIYVGKNQKFKETFKKILGLN